uniref:HAUS augmin like complex subunit 5 n=1 Tax=Nothobranchius furzeri TaxID=105023 RepID=A0A8C6QAT5_NOTFU
MADRNLVKELKRWATEEFNLPPDTLPNDSYLKTLCVGTGKSIWKYIIQHVFHQRNVKIMRVCWVVCLHVKLVQTKGQSEAAKRKELQMKIEQLKCEISHLDSQISGTEEQLAAQEQSVGQTWAQMEDSQSRELFLQAFRRHCTLNRNLLSDDVQKISSHCQVLEQMESVETEVLFDDAPSSSRADDDFNSQTVAVAQVLVRELSEDRVNFYQSLQESELKTQPSATKNMTHEQRMAVFQYWLSTAEKVLSNYPPSHILSALQHLAAREQRELQERVTTLDVTKDAAALQFRYESNHLLDISAEEGNELPPVKTLLEAVWDEVQQSLVELSQTRSRVLQLKDLLQDRKKEAEEETLAEQTESVVELQSFEVELQCVMKAAARDHIRDHCIQLDQHARNRQEALRNLCSQWQNIQDFRELALRQEQLRGLIKGNSSTKTQLTCLHKELQEFIEIKLKPQFEDVIIAASSLRNSISKEVIQFGNVSLLSLDRRTVEGMQRLPVSSLSIYRLQSSSFSNLCQTLKFPRYKAPEELCSQLRSQQLEMCFLHELLKLYSFTLQKVQKEAEQLHAPDQKALLSRVTEEDQKLLKDLLPRARGLTHHCAQGLFYGAQVKTAISDWWDKPAQHALPDVVKGGLTFQQWLQRWRIATKAC